MDINDDFTCPVCNKSFRTIKSRNTHLSTAANCSWYRHGKLKWLPDSTLAGERRDSFSVYDLGQRPARTNTPATDLSPEEAVDQMEEMAHPGDYEDLFHFIDRDPPLPDPSFGEAGPGPSTAAHRNRMLDPRLLDDEEDSRVEIVQPTAGKVICMNDTLHQVWRRHFKSADHDGDIEMGDGHCDAGDKNGYAPFASKMDWEIARWMVKEDPGHGAFDRLLEIPGVSLCLTLSALEPN